MIRPPRPITLRTIAALGPGKTGRLTGSPRQWLMMPQKSMIPDPGTVGRQIGTKMVQDLGAIGRQTGIKTVQDLGTDGHPRGPNPPMRITKKVRGRVPGTSGLPVGARKIRPRTAPTAKIRGLGTNGRRVGERKRIRIPVLGMSGLRTSRVKSDTVQTLLAASPRSNALRHSTRRRKRSTKRSATIGNAGGGQTIPSAVPDQDPRGNEKQYYLY